MADNWYCREINWWYWALIKPYSFNGDLDDFVNANIQGLG